LNIDRQPRWRDRRRLSGGFSAGISE